MHTVSGGNVTVLTGSVRDAVRADKLCADAGIRVAVVPPPAGLSAGCGMAIRVAQEEIDAFDELMNENGIDVSKRI